MCTSRIFQCTMAEISSGDGSAKGSARTARPGEGTQGPSDVGHCLSEVCTQ